MNQKKELILFALERGLLQFGCASGKPGGRSLSPESKAAIEKAGGKTCAIETKSGKTAWYTDHSGDSSTRKKGTDGKKDFLKLPEEHQRDYVVNNRRRFEMDFLPKKNSLPEEEKENILLVGKRQVGYLKAR